MNGFVEFYYFADRWDYAVGGPRPVITMKQVSRGRMPVVTRLNEEWMPELDRGMTDEFLMWCENPGDDGEILRVQMLPRPWREKFWVDLVDAYGGHVRWTRANRHRRASGRDRVTEKLCTGKR